MVNPERRQEEQFNIDTTQHTGGGEKEKTEMWSSFALRHKAELRVLKDAGLLGEGGQEWRNVAEHLLVVGGMAGFLSKKIKEQGVDVDPELAEVAAILHDASKRLDVENKVRYAQEKKKGALVDLLREHGYKEDFIEVCSYTARVPEIYLDEKDQNDQIDKKGWEQLILAYCDARVRNTEIVSLEDARDKNKQKVPKDSDFYDQWYRFYKKVEARIFGAIAGMRPEELDVQKVLGSIE